MSARIVFLIVVLGIVPKTQAATMLFGAVLANELSGPPMANVQVSAVAGNTSNTDATGKFTFKFPNRNPGDKVHLIIRKEGYVVVNYRELQFNLPSDPEENPVIFLLSTEADRPEMAHRYYGLKVAAAIDQAYRTKISNARYATFHWHIEEDGNITSSDTGGLFGGHRYTTPWEHRDVEALKQERDHAKQVAEMMVQELVKQKPNDRGELYYTAVRLFLEGKIDRALAVSATTSEGNRHDQGVHDTQVHRGKGQ